MKPGDIVICISEKTREYYGYSQNTQYRVLDCLASHGTKTTNYLIKIENDMLFYRYEWSNDFVVVRHATIVCTCGKFKAEIAIRCKRCDGRFIYRVKRIKQWISHYFSAYIASRW